MTPPLVMVFTYKSQQTLLDRNCKNVDRVHNVAITTQITGYN